MQRHKETGLGGGDLDRVEVCVRRAKQSADRRLDTFIYQTWYGRCSFVRGFDKLRSP